MSQEVLNQESRYKDRSQRSLGRESIAGKSEKSIKYDSLKRLSTEVREGELPKL